MHLGILAVNELAELNPFDAPATSVRRTTDGSNWSAPGNVFGGVILVGIIGMRSEQNYSYKTDFETTRKNQYFGRQNISMSRLPLESTPFGTKMTNVTTSPIDLIPVRTKIPDQTPQTRPT